MTEGNRASHGSRQEGDWGGALSFQAKAPPPALQCTLHSSMALRTSSPDGREHPSTAPNARAPAGRALEHMDLRPDHVGHAGHRERIVELKAR